MEYIGEKKVCPKCTFPKETKEFRVDIRASDGLRSWCHRCELDSAYAYQKTEAGKAKIRRASYTILRFGHSKNKAKKRGIEWTITKEDFNKLKTLPCHYCGDEIITTGSGLDRMDNTRGYHLDNVVPCCNICNTMKLDYWSYGEMLQIGALSRELRLKRVVPNNT